MEGLYSFQNSLKLHAKKLDVWEPNFMHLPQHPTCPCVADRVCALPFQFQTSSSCQNLDDQGKGFMSHHLRLQRVKRSKKEGVIIKMAIIVVEEPILSRIDRLNHLLKQLEEIRGLSRSTKSSSPSGLSTPSSWALTSDGHSDDTSPTPRSMEQRCRPINHVIMETEVKGSLIERLDHVESRIVKMEEELEAERKRKPLKKKRWLTKLLKGGGEKHRLASDALV